MFTASAATVGDPVSCQVSKHTFSRFSGTPDGEAPAPSRVSSSHSKVCKLSSSSSPGSRWQPFFQPELTSSPAMLDSHHLYLNLPSPLAPTSNSTGIFRLTCQLLSRRFRLSILGPVASAVVQWMKPDREMPRQVVAHRFNKLPAPVINEEMLAACTSFHWLGIWFTPKCLNW